MARRLFDACEECRDTLSAPRSQPSTRSVARFVPGCLTGRKKSTIWSLGQTDCTQRSESLAFGPQDQFENHLGFYVAAFILPGYRPRDELAYISHTQPGRQISRVALRDDQTLILFVFSGDLLTRHTAGEADQRAALNDVYKGMGWEADAILSRMDESQRSLL